MRKWLIDHPDASPKEAREQMTAQLQGESARHAADAYKPKLPEKAAVPTAPAAPAPKSIGPPTSPPISSTRGESHNVAQVTAYRPGGTRAMGLSAKTEGGPLDAHGNMILGRSTMEDYAEGRGNYVTVAMDIASDWQGKYLISAAYPGVVFKVMDNGDHCNHKTGRDWVTSHGKIQRWRATSYARCAIRGRQGAINNAEERSEPSAEITRSAVIKILSQYARSEPDEYSDEARLQARALLNRMTGGSSNKGKRRLVETALRADPDKSNREIARETSTTHPFVARMRRELELWHYGDRGDPGARFRAANFAYLSWRVGHDLAVGYYPEVGEYEVYRDACIKHFGNTKIIDELELFDLIAAQFSDPPSSGIGIRHSTNLDPRGPRAICNHAAS